VRDNWSSVAPLYRKTATVAILPLQLLPLQPKPQTRCYLIVVCDRQSKVRYSSYCAIKVGYKDESKNWALFSCWRPRSVYRRQGESLNFSFTFKRTASRCVPPRGQIPRIFNVVNSRSLWPADVDDFFVGMWGSLSTELQAVVVDIGARMNSSILEFKEKSPNSYILVPRLENKLHVNAITASKEVRERVLVLMANSSRRLIHCRAGFNFLFDDQLRISGPWRTQVMSSRAVA